MKVENLLSVRPYCPLEIRWAFQSSLIQTKQVHLPLMFHSLFAIVAACFHLSHSGVPKPHMLTSNELVNHGDLCDPWLIFTSNDKVSDFLTSNHKQHVHDSSGKKNRMPRTTTGMSHGPSHGAVMYVTQETKWIMKWMSRKNATKTKHMKSIWFTLPSVTLFKKESKTNLRSKLHLRCGKGHSVSVQLLDHPPVCRWGDMGAHEWFPDHNW